MRDPESKYKQTNKQTEGEVLKGRADRTMNSNGQGVLYIYLCVD